MVVRENDGIWRIDDNWCVASAVQTICAYAKPIIISDSKSLVMVIWNALKEYSIHDAR